MAIGITIAISSRWLTKDFTFPQTDPYGFCSGNTLLYIDVWGLYSDDVHFLATYWMAIDTEFREEIAKELAYYAEYPDNVPELDAVTQGWRGMFFATPEEEEWMKRTQGAFHQLNGNTVEYEEKCIRCCLRKIYRESDKLWEKGFVLHALGDTYGHITLTETVKYLAPPPSGRDLYRPQRTCYGSGGKMYSAGLGHFWAGSAPDDVSTRPSLAIDYLNDAYQLISGGKPISQIDYLSKWRKKGETLSYKKCKSDPSFGRKSITREQFIEWMEKLERCAEGK